MIKTPLLWDLRATDIVAYDLKLVMWWRSSFEARVGGAQTDGALHNYSSHGVMNIEAFRGTFVSLFTFMQVISFRYEAIGDHTKRAKENSTQKISQCAIPALSYPCLHSSALSSKADGDTSSPPNKKYDADNLVLKVKVLPKKKSLKTLTKTPTQSFVADIHHKILSLLNHHNNSVNVTVFYHVI